MKITKTKDSKIFLLRLETKDFDSRGIVKEFSLLSYIGQFFERQILMGLKEQAECGLVLNWVSSNVLAFDTRIGCESYLRVRIKREARAIWHVIVEVNHQFEGGIGRISLAYRSIDS